MISKQIRFKEQKNTTVNSRIYHKSSWTVDRTRILIPNRRNTNNLQNLVHKIIKSRTDTSKINRSSKTRSDTTCWDENPNWDLMNKMRKIRTNTNTKIMSNDHSIYSNMRNKLHLWNKNLTLQETSQRGGYILPHS